MDVVDERKIFPLDGNMPITFEFEVGDFVYLERVNNNFTGPCLVLSVGVDRIGRRSFVFSGNIRIDTWLYTEKS